MLEETATVFTFGVNGKYHLTPNNNLDILSRTWFFFFRTRPRTPLLCLFVCLLLDYDGKLIMYVSVGRNGCIALHYYVHFLRIFSFVTRWIESEGVGARFIYGWLGKTSGIQRYYLEFGSHVFESGLGSTQTVWLPYKSCTNTLTFDSTSDERENS